MSDLEILRAVRDLISAPGRWTKNWYARNYIGEQVASDDASACCWCIAGALHKIGGLETGAWDILQKHVQAKGYDNIVRFQDAPLRTHEEVLAFLDEAITELKVTNG